MRLNTENGQKGRLQYLILSSSPLRLFIAYSSYHHEVKYNNVAENIAVD
jgi:hypothetical protein